MTEPTSNPGRSPVPAMVGICALILILAAMYWAQNVFAPLTFALLLIAMLWPFQRALQSRMPQLLALLFSLTVTIVVMVLFSSLLAWSLSRVGRYALSDTARFQTMYSELAVWLEGRGIVVSGLWEQHFNASWVIRIVQHVSGRLNTTLTFLLVVLIYVMLGLLEVSAIGRKLAGFKPGSVGQAFLIGSGETAAKLRRYMWVRTLMSIMTGVLVWGLTYAAGLSLSAEWGVIAFALNYIPVIGPLFATVLPTLFAIAQFETWQAAVLVFVLLNLIQFLVGSYLEPRIAGNALSISPVMVLFAVFFGTFLWGIAGAFIGVPIVIAAVTICAHHESSRWIADILGVGPAETSKN
ncbi:AI-2E family transporter [Kaistia granuli]|jgi:AI-2 transport protein TqsA|uniref:AI-2E family transporter n=1 Tax=Kaistia granuli TaxID=363259 RepID=UPI000370C395|nr:AI-2E family transporter [Kaistia granuli]